VLTESCTGFLALFTLRRDVFGLAPGRGVRAARWFGAQSTGLEGGVSNACGCPYVQEAPSFTSFRQTTVLGTGGPWNSEDGGLASAG